MRSARKAFVPRTILLLSESAIVAEQIEQALATYCLAHHIQWHVDIRSFQQSLISSHLQPESAAHVDLFLIAYVDDTLKAQQTLLELSKLVRWKKVPSVLFLNQDDPTFVRMLYHLGANSVLKFPPRFDSLQQLISTMDAYWFDAVTLPFSEDE
ncbi:MAG: hypothetical protein LAT65_18585 [Saccharospirillum sp.]|nr:hypothetical protein [Saccharospirillum sp.]